MVRTSDTTCPKCGGELKYIGPVKRLVRTKGGNKHWIKIRRMLCKDCSVVHRELPDYLLPFKHYESDIIEGVIDGVITPYVLGYEDFPSETTMKRWLRTRNKHAPL